MELFEFGKYWNTTSFILYIIIGIVVSKLCQKGARLNYRLNKDKEKNNRYYIIAFLILVFIYTFRDSSVGSDTSGYVEVFNRAVLRINWSEILLPKQVEPLYQLVNYGIHLISDNYTLLFLFYGIVITYAYIKFIRVFWTLELDYVFLIGFVVGYTYTFTAMRSSMGMAFILLSFCCLKDSKYGKAILLTFIGYLFHYTTIVNVIFIIIYYLISKRNTLNKARLFGLTLLLLLTVYFSVNIMKSYFLETRYHGYVEKAGGTLIGNWTVVLSFIVAIWLIKNRKIETKEMMLCVCSAVYSMVLLIPSMILGAYRLTTFYELPNLVLFGLAGSYFYKNKSYKEVMIWKTLYFAMIVFYCLFVLSRRSGTEGFTYILKM